MFIKCSKIIKLRLFQTLIKVLEAWTGKSFAKNVELILPETNIELFAQQGDFPEYQLFEYQKHRTKHL